MRILVLWAGLFALLGALAQEDENIDRRQRDL